MIVDPNELSKPQEVESLYFAQPINIFKTELKEKLLAAIRERFPGVPIEDPDTKEHQEGYVRDGMAYYTGKVLRRGKRIVFLAFRDGMIGTGVFAEVRKVIENGGVAAEIFPDASIRENVTLDPARMLSVEETRARIRFPSEDPNDPSKKGPPRPY
ncbi:MAG: hypothetical protein WC866_03120 [Patescibacteria group bacterium]|jgi:hypothetical protein